MASRRGPDNSVRIAISGLVKGANWANVFHAQLTTSSTITQADLDTWTTAFGAAFVTNIPPRQSTEVTTTLAKAILYTPGGGELISQATLAGTGSGTPLDAGNAPCKVISWLSTVYWRGGKPRSYIAGLISGDLTTATNALTATAVSNLTTSAAALRTAINALTSGTITGTQFGFLSFRSGNAERPTPLFFAITGARVHARVGTQRRRDGRWLN